MVAIGTDKPGHSLRNLVYIALMSLPEESLYGFLRDKDHIVASMAAQQLQVKSNLSDRTFTEASILAQSANARHREIAAFILGQLCPPEYPYKEKALPILISLLDDKMADVRASAIAALGHLKAKSLKQRILDALNETSANVLQCAAYSLWSIGLTEDDKQVMRALSDRSDAKTRKWILSFLEADRKIS